MREVRRVNEDEGGKDSEYNTKPVKIVTIN